MLVLDTDHVSLLQWGGGEEAERLRARLQIADEEVAVTVISYEEQTRGWLAYVARARTLSQFRESPGPANRRLDNLKMRHCRRRINSRRDDGPSSCPRVLPRAVRRQL